MNKIQTIPALIPAAVPLFVLQKREDSMLRPTVRAIKRDMGLQELLCKVTTF